jgi:hypothetical protein
MRWIRLGVVGLLATLSVALALSLRGSIWIPADAPRAIQPPSGETQAIQIAKRALAAKDDWADRATYQAHRDGYGWTVTAWRIEGYGKDGKPQFVPGGNRVIVIDGKGKVIEYARGY